MAIIFWGVGRLPSGRGAIFFPLWGAVLGAAGAGIFVAVGRAIPPSLAALLTVAFWTGLSGVPREDARIGAAGAAALILSVVARWQALEHLANPQVLVICIAAQAAPRAAMVALAWVSRPAGSGLLAFSSTLTTPAALAAIALGIAASFLGGFRAGVIIIAGTYLILRLAQWHCYKRIGGINLNCLAATEQALEIFILWLGVLLQGGR